MPDTKNINNTLPIHRTFTCHVVTITNLTVSKYLAVCRNKRQQLLVNPDSRPQVKLAGCFTNLTPFLFLPLPTGSVGIWIVNANVSRLSVCSAFPPDCASQQKSSCRKTSDFKTLGKNKRLLKGTSIKPAEIWKGNVCYYQRSTWPQCDLYVTLWAPLCITALDRHWIKMQAIKEVYKSDRAMAQAVCRQLRHKPRFDPSPVSVGFLVDKLELRPVYIREIQFSPASLTLRRLMSYIYGAPILDVSRSHTTTQHSR